MAVIATTQQKIWPKEPKYGPLEIPTEEECDVLHALCSFANSGELSGLVSEMVEGGVCEDGREWLRSVLEVRA